MDWAITSTAFGAERQRGFTLHNARDKAISYAVGVYTGENVRSSAAMGLAQAYGESPGNQSDLVDPAKPERIHPEIVAHFAYNSIALSAAYDMRPDPYNDISWLKHKYITGDRNDVRFRSQLTLAF